MYPTETSYGIGCSAWNAQAVRKVFEFKNRPIEKAVPLVVSSLEEAKKLIVWDETVEQLTRAYWPGPFTIVARATPDGVRMPPGIVEADGTIALRVSSHPIAEMLAQAVGPIVATSANNAGDPSCFTVDAVKLWLRDADVFVLDAGPLPLRAHSTIVRVVDGWYKILRGGAIKI